MREAFKEYIDNIHPIKEETFNKLFDCCSILNLKKGDYFVNIGEVPKTIGYVNKGILRAYVLNDKGKEYNKNLFKAPNVVWAYTALVTKTPNKIALQALTDCEMIVADYDAILEIYSKNKDLEEFVRTATEDIYIEKEKKEIEMVMLEAVDRYKIFKQTHPEVEQMIPQYHIASYLGISATQLSRIRHKINKRK